MKYNENSCRYDSFTLIYYFIINDIIKNKEISDNLKILIEFYNKFIENITNSDKTILDKGIWRFIDNLTDDPYNFKKVGYKQVFAISQLFAPFNNNKIFCFEIVKEETCFKCNYSNNLMEYLGPILQINLEDLNNSLKITLENKLKNHLVLCHKCTWIDHGNKILSNIPTLSKIIKNIELPDIMFLFFDIGEERDDTFKVYNNIKLNLEQIINYIEDEFYIFNSKYALKGIICMPYVNHYTSLIVGADLKDKFIKKGANYYYDDQKYDNNLILIKDYKSHMKDNGVPYILIYTKIL